MLAGVAAGEARKKEGRKTNKQKEREERKKGKP
jgi:hypothetical protein